MNVSKLEEMGTILMHIALQYTHPDFESMYSDWSTVHDIGEKLVKMSEQPQLNDNQRIVLEYLKKQFGKYEMFIKSIFDPIQELLSDCWNGEVNIAFEQLDLKQEIQVLEVFGQWALEQEEE